MVFISLVDLGDGKFMIFFDEIADKFNPDLFEPTKVGSLGAVSLGVGRALVGGSVYWRYFFRLVLFLSIVSLMKVSIMAVAAMAAIY